MSGNKTSGKASGCGFGLILFTCVSAPQAADNAAVLPQGVSRGYIDFYHYLPTKERYNDDGEREALAFPFSDAALDSSVFPALAPLDGAPVGGGKATLGDVMVEYEYDIEVIDFGYAYGMSDRLSIGFHVPYFWITNNVDTAFDNSSANVGINPGAGPPLIPIGAGGVPMQEQDVQDFIVSSFGFSEIDTWQREGIGDIELGAKYLVYREGATAFAVTGALRIPTGYEDDVDKLDDVAWSYGNYALLLRLHYDYLLNSSWDESRTQLDSILPQPGDLILNLTFRFDYMLPDDKIMRIGDTPRQIFTNNRERVERKLGDIYNLEISARYQATAALSFDATYSLAFKSKDDIDGDLGFDYSSLEAHTDWEQQVITLGAAWSTLAAYREQQRRLPLQVSLAYRERFDGEGPSSGQTSPRLYTRWWVVGVDLLF